MKVNKFESKEDWLEARTGKITGSTLKDIVVKRGTTPKIGFYQLIADRLAIPRQEGENVLERGNLLEPEAIEKFTEVTGLKVNTDLVIWERDDNSNIAISPDGYIGETEAVEVKCLASARHIEALLTQKTPSEYEFQILQYFIVNEKLQKLYFCFYDPSLTVKQLHYIIIERDDEKVEQYLEYQRKTLEEVATVVNNLSF